MTGDGRRASMATRYRQRCRREGNPYERRHGIDGSRAASVRAGVAPVARRPPRDARLLPHQGQHPQRRLQALPPARQPQLRRHQGRVLVRLPLRSRSGRVHPRPHPPRRRRHRPVRTRRQRPPLHPRTGRSQPHRGDRGHGRPSVRAGVAPVARRPPRDARLLPHQGQHPQRRLQALPPTRQPQLRRHQGRVLVRLPLRSRSGRVHPRPHPPRRRRHRPVRTRRQRPPLHPRTGPGQPHRSRNRRGRCRRAGSRRRRRGVDGRRARPGHHHRPGPSRRPLASGSAAWPQRRPR